ncbi:hypothetical protein [Cryobacterium lyxosi]|uniref:Uncharacterized protein n=1 Tax=Cryobacterium lyxosi TaxID=1259228 RepID=A0A4R8ZEG3_9MICO|nr:hypothetical protein [Cryobacterium lyxosi]TFD25866.1 hypothetical protein E3T27_08660 [Cryobacterium lyxosi]
MDIINLEGLGEDPETIRKNRRVTSIAKTYTEKVVKEREQIEQALKAGLTLSAHTLMSAGYADTAKAAFAELNQKDN